jgi:hypothetical protein
MMRGFPRLILATLAGLAEMVALALFAGAIIAGALALNP